MSYLRYPGGGGGGGDFSIPEVDTDPASPDDGDAWVLRTGGGGGAPVMMHSIFSLGMVLGTGGGATTYQLSYKTISDGIKRVTLT